MRIRLLKLTIAVSVGAFFAIFSLNGSPVRAYSSGPDPSLTGAPGESTCSSCHSGGPLGGTLTLSGFPTTYTPNQEVTLTVTLTQSNRGRFGFQLTAIDDSGKKAGDLTPTDSRTQTQFNTVNGDQRQYINHTFDGSGPFAVGVGKWTFKWKAPAQSVGRVTFYFVGNAANNNGQDTGDSIYQSDQSIQPAATLTSLTTVLAASFSGAAPITANAIVAGFGSGLSQNVVVASTIPLPTTLDGTEVKVKDASGVERSAGLFFVSPFQVNYLIPTGTANGAATITLRRNGVNTAQGTTPVDTVSPSLFTANASGTGVPSAFLFRRRNGVDTLEQVATLNGASGQFEAIPIDMGPDGDLVALIAYGTGFRGISAQSAASATIGGTDSQVLFVGAAPGFEGLDQTNIVIPRSLIGRGSADLIFKVDGKTANTVTIKIK
jgi:uncharacterized protein (TIGR03437 family)